MECDTIQFSEHALRQIFERGISIDDVISAVRKGEIIARYTDDRPYPSALILAEDASGPLHVVAAKDDELNNCIIVTAYRPNPASWTPDFRTRRK